MRSFKIAIRNGETVQEIMEGFFNFFVKLLIAIWKVYVTRYAKKFDLLDLLFLLQLIIWLHMYHYLGLN